MAIDPQEVADILDGLDTPTPDEVYHATKDYDTNYIVAAVGSKAYGPGGGSITGTVREYVIPLAWNTPGFTDGVEVYTPTPGDMILYAGVSFPVGSTPFASSVEGSNCAISLGFADEHDAFKVGGGVNGLTDANTIADDNGHLVNFENGEYWPSSATYFADDEPVVATLFNEAVGDPSDPGATQGECEVRICVVHKGTAP